MKKVIALVLSAVIMLSVLTACSGGQNSTSNVSSSGVASAELTPYENGIKAIENKDYLSAIYYFKSIYYVDDDYQKAQEKLEECELAYVEQVLQKAATYAEKGEYVSAIETINFAQDTVIHTKLQEAEDGYIADYWSIIETAADEAYASSGYDAAVSKAEEALEDFPDDRNISRLISEYKAKYHVYLLTDITPISVVGNSVTGYQEIADINGKMYGEHSTLSVSGTGNATVTFELGGQYSKLGGTLFVPAVVEKSGNATVMIWADNRKIYSNLNVNRNTSAIELQLDVSGVSRVEIFISNAGQEASPITPYIADLHVIK